MHQQASISDGQSAAAGVTDNSSASVHHNGAAPATPVHKKTKSIEHPSEVIIGSSFCLTCLYNIPRSSLMLTLPGLVIVVCGAAMMAFRDESQPWTTGRNLIAIVCLAVGGAWTIGGLVYWGVVWCRNVVPEYRKRRRRRQQQTVSVTSARRGHVSPIEDEQTAAGGVCLQAVYSYRQDGDSLRRTPAREQRTNNIQLSRFDGDDDGADEIPTISCVQPHPQHPQQEKGTVSGMPMVAIHNGHPA